MASSLSAVVIEKLNQVLQVLYNSFIQLHPKTNTLFLTLDQIPLAAAQLDLPLPDDYLDVLDLGVRLGTFLRCVTAETQFLGDKVLMYSYNPNMLAANALNRKVISYGAPCNGRINLYTAAYATHGVHVTESNARFPFPNYGGEVVGINSGGCGGGAPSQLPTSVILRISCCKK